MALHHSLRELVDARGAGVVSEADELRGALDDFLGEDEATLGEINLLVDAVRLGALRRVRDVLAHGAHPEAAIREAGAALARDRGTDDPTRSCWALATLCFALGAIDDPLLARFPGTTSRPAATLPEPVLEPDPEPMPDPPVVVPEPAEPTAYVPPPPPAPIPAPWPRRAGLVAVTVVLVLLVAVGVGWWLLRDADDADPAADDDRTSEAATNTGTTEPTDDPTDNPTDDPTDNPTDDPTDAVLAASADEIVVPFVVDGVSHLFAVHADNDQVRQLTEGAGDELLPSVSPDRTQIAYLLGPRPFELWTLDADGELVRAPLADDPACAHATRPGWSPDGRRVALVCTGNDDVPDGIYLADGDLSEPEQVLVGTGFAGSPTWIDATRFVYGVTSPDGVRRLWLYDTATTADAVIELDGLANADLTHADWSEDQQQLVFLVHPDPDSEFGELWVVGPDLADPQQLGGAYGHPAWAPTGDRIAVTVIDDGVEKLAVVRTVDPLSPVVLETPDLPADVVVGIPAWGTR